MSRFLLLLCLIAGFVAFISALRCYGCNSNNVNCVNNVPEKYSFNCPEGKGVIGCYQYYFHKGRHGRSCAFPTEKNFKRCLANDMKGCYVCKFANCNSLPLRVNRTQKCIIAKGDFDTTGHLLPTVCPGEVSLFQPDYCYQVITENNGRFKTIDRGCFPFEGKLQKNQLLFYCSAMSCNMYAPTSGRRCSRDVPEGENPVSTLCARSKYETTPPFCYNLFYNNGTFSKGCLNSLTLPQIYDCSYSGRPDHVRNCQICGGDRPCNLVSNNVRRCRDENNITHVCSQVNSRCYIHLRNGKVLKAGCAEPTVDLEILTHQDTHFCDDDREPYQGCFDPTRDYSKRISCFTCYWSTTNTKSKCRDHESLTWQHASMCPVGATRCIIATLSNWVYRACDTWTDQTAIFCRMNPSRCFFCNTNYCNQMPPFKNTAKCYSTETHVATQEGYSFEMRACTGVIPAPTTMPCYVANLNNVRKTASCIENLSFKAEENTVRRGDSRVIFEAKMMCYKCRSNRREYCFNVRWLEPQVCENDILVADRGCYTLFDASMKRIERGCVSDLDPYMRGVCSISHYKNFCIFCAEDYCNIQDTPEDVIWEPIWQNIDTDSAKGLGLMGLEVWVVGILWLVVLR